MITVDEFAEVDIPGLQPLSREEFRDVCNAGKTRPAILQRLSQALTVSEGAILTTMAKAGLPIDPSRCVVQALASPPEAERTARRIGEH